MGVLFYLIQNRSVSRDRAPYLPHTVSRGAITEEDILEEVCQSSVFHAAEAKALLDRYHDRIFRRLAEGYNVITPSAVFRPVVRGIFETGESRFQRGRHSVSVSVSPARQLQKAVRRTGKGSRTDPADKGPHISQLLNSEHEPADAVEPGGLYVLRGSRLKVDSKKGEGLFLSGAGAVRWELQTVAPGRGSREVVIRTPLDLPAGVYRCRARTFQRRRALLEQDLNFSVECRIPSPVSAV